MRGLARRTTVLSTVQSPRHTRSFFPSHHTYLSRLLSETPDATILPATMEGPVEVVVDLANIEAGARTLSGRFEPASFMRLFADRSDTRVAVFGAEAVPGSIARDWSPLGAEVFARPIVSDGFTRKGNLDVEIALWAAVVAHQRAKTLILASGDSDFAVLGHLLIPLGHPVYCLSWSHCLGRELSQACSGSILAGKDLLVSQPTRKEA